MFSLSQVFKFAGEAPPGLRQAGVVGSNCTSCKYYDKVSNCTKYSYPVQPTMTCDDYESVELDINQIKNAKPVEGMKAKLGPAPDPETFKFGQDKQARVKRPDRGEDFLKTFNRLSHHPDTTSGVMVTPLKAWHEAAGREYESHMDKAKKNREEAEKAMTTKEAMKAGLLLRCAEAGLTLDQLESHIDSLLEKTSAEAAGSLVGQGLSAASNLVGQGLGHLKDYSLAALIGGPVVLGGTTGYLAGRLAPKKFDSSPELVKRDELKNEYLRLADEAKRRAAIRRMQEESPGSIVQLS